MNAFDIRTVLFAKHAQHVVLIFLYARSPVAPKKTSASDRGLTSGMVKTGGDYLSRV